MNEVIPAIRRDFLAKALKEGLRADGRTPEEYRAIELQTGVAPKAHGSALCRLGGTQVVAGVTVSEGRPYPNLPGMGVLKTLVLDRRSRYLDGYSFWPLDPTEVARVVDRGIRAGCLDLAAMGLDEGERALVVHLDMLVLDWDGNVYDAATLAALAALEHTEVPDEVADGRFKSLPLRRRVVTVTVSRVYDTLVLDPCGEEEYVSESRLTVALDQDGYIRAMQKGNIGGLHVEEVSTAVGMALKALPGLLQAVDRATGG